MPGFNLMRNIIPKGFWAQNTPGRSRSAAVLNRALGFSLSLSDNHDEKPTAVTREASRQVDYRLRDSRRGTPQHAEPPRYLLTPS